MDAIAVDFAEHGAAAIAKVRIDDPIAYLKIVGSLVPRELIMRRKVAPPINVWEIDHEELVEYVEERRRQQSIEGILKSVG